MSVIGERDVWVDVMGSSMAAVDAGRGEAVLLGHSYLWDAEMWRPQIDLMSRQYRVIAPDLWGHGSSGPLPRGTEDLRDLARHHLMLLDQLGVERFAVVGLSLGGMWAVELAGLAPERVTALALLDTFVGPEPAASRDRYLAMFKAIEAADKVPEAILDAVVPLFFSADVQATAPELPAQFRLALAGWDRDRLIDSVLPLGRLFLHRRDALADLHELEMPALVMTGAEDIPRPPREGRQMAEALGCRFVELPGAGHISTLEAPEAVAEHLLAFLAEALAGKPASTEPS
jgi:pimeloyl-ACP methyl ester carboxylesterase